MFDGDFSVTSPQSVADVIFIHEVARLRNRPHRLRTSLWKRILNRSFRRWADGVCPAGAIARPFWTWKPPPNRPPAGPSPRCSPRTTVPKAKN